MKALFPIFLALFGFLYVVASAAELSQPQASANDPFSSVTPDLREEVKEDVALIVKLHKERQWGKIYDLADHGFPITRDKYIQDSRHMWALVDFFPTGVQHRSSEDTDWTVNGCLIAEEKGEKKKWESFIEIKLDGHSKKRIVLLVAMKKNGSGAMDCLNPPSGQ